MSDFDLTQLLRNSPPSGEIKIPSGEFEGAWVVDKAIHLVGSGLSTVLWKEKGPVLRIQSPGVKITNLSLEVTADGDTIALEVSGSIQPTPQFHGVRVLGKVSGLADWNSWNFPPVIDLGKIRGKSRLERTIGLPVSSAMSIRSIMAGLTAEVSQSSLGQRTLRLVVESEILNPGALLDGLLEVEMAGIFTLVRITGEVFTTAPTVASSRDGDAQIIEGVDIFASVKPASHKSDQVTKHPEPAPQQLQFQQAQQPVSVDQLIVNAENAEKRQEIDAAEELLKQAMQQKPMDLRIHRQLADFYERHNNLTGATIHWEFLHHAEAENVEVILHLAKCYSQTNHYSGAIDLLEKSLHLSRAKQNVEIYRSLAFAYYHNKSIDEAVWALEQALNIKDDRKLALLLRTWQQKMH